MARRDRPDMTHGETTEAAFVRTYEHVYENSPWIAKLAWRSGIHSREPAVIAGIMREIVEQAGRQAQTELLRAHPDLAGRLALRNELTPESASEQSSAGLDQCSPGELAEFQVLNDRYKNKFGFPFILAVRGRNRSEILAAFRDRVGNDAETEFREALDQVHQIARLRLELLRDLTV